MGEEGISSQSGGTRIIIDSEHFTLPKVRVDETSKVLSQQPSPPARPEAQLSPSVHFYDRLPRKHGARQFDSYSHPDTDLMFIRDSKDTMSCIEAIHIILEMRGGIDYDRVRVLLGCPQDESVCRIKNSTVLDLI